MIISAIAAMDQNRCIGHQQRLPWHLPDDLAFFKSITLHRVIIMGRKTFESLPGVLPYRTHVVLSRTKKHLDHALCFQNIDDAIHHFGQEKEIIIIGGSEIFEATQHLWQKMYLTHVEAQVVGDCYFPHWQEKNWRVIKEKKHPSDAKHAHAFRLVTYEKIQPSEMIGLEKKRIGKVFSS